MVNRKVFSLAAVACAGVALALLVVSAVVRRDDILRTWLDPKQPFQTYHPPAAPDYANAVSWALIPAQPSLWRASDPPADVFFVAPTTFNGGRDWNGPIGDRRADNLLTRVMLPNYAGPFQRVGRVFAPRYRQASLYSFMTNKEDAQDARRFAYGDVRRAFQLFLQRYSQGRPFVVVGVEQGGGLAARLVSDVVANDPQLLDRFAAAYLIDTLVPAGDYGPGSKTPACTAKGQAGCVLAWQAAMSDADAARDVKRDLVWSPAGDLQNLGDRAPLCVNPMLGEESGALAPPKLDLGAVNATGLEGGVRPAFLPREVSAQCLGGVLRISKPVSPMLRRSGGWTDRLKAAPFNLFYLNEEVDAAGRIAALTHRPGYAPPTPSAGASIVIAHAPIHRIS
jgi:hypothetical protein